MGACMKCGAMCVALIRGGNEGERDSAALAVALDRARGSNAATNAPITHWFALLTQYIVFKITADKKFIEIECKGDKGASFEEFTSKLPDGDCRYAVLDVEIATKSGATTNKLIFVAWCPPP